LKQLGFRKRKKHDIGSQPNKILGQHGVKRGKKGLYLGLT